MKILLVTSAPGAWISRSKTVRKGFRQLTTGLDIVVGGCPEDPKSCVEL